MLFRKDLIILLYLIATITSIVAKSDPANALFYATGPPTPSLREQADEWMEKAHVYFLEEEFEEAQKAYQKAANFYHEDTKVTQYAEEPLSQAKDRISQSYKEERQALTYRGDTLIIQGRYTQALENLNQALQIAEEIQDEGKKYVLNLRADVYRNQGRFTQALEDYETILKLVKDPIEKASVMANMASTHLGQGEYEEALKDYQEALNALQQEQKEEETEERKELQRKIAIIHNNRGETHRQLGDYTKALRDFRTARNILHTWDDQEGEANTFIGIGAVHEEQGHYLEAIDIYEQALTISDDLIITRAVLKNNMAKTWDRFCRENRNSQHHKEALQLYKDALETFIANKSRALAANTLSNIGELYIHLSSYDDKKEQLDLAKKFLDEAWEIQRTIGDRSREWSTISHIGRVYELQENLPKAEEHYKTAIDLLERFFTFSTLEEVIIGMHARAAETYQRMVLLLIHMKKPEKAFEYSEHARARAFLNRLANKGRNLYEKTTEDELQKEQALRLEVIELEEQLERQLQDHSEKPGDKNPIRSLRQQLKQKRDDYEILRRTIKLNHPEYASMISVEPLTLQEIQQSLDPRITLLSYFVTPDTTVAFVITNNAFETVQLLIGERALKPLIETSRIIALEEDPPPKALEDLYKHLIAPLKDHLNTPLVGIIPHGILHYLSFASLKGPDRYFGDKFALFSLPSATTLKYVQKKQNPQSNKSLLFLATPRKGDTPSLEFIPPEAREIAEILAQDYDVKLLISTEETKEATKTAFKELANEYAIVHLSAHAILNPATPLFSRIGALNLYEVYDLSLQQANLVALSACDTKLGRLSKGDDLIGLTRAFIHAGSPSVIASLWKVNGEATRDFMIAFYKHLKDGKSKINALQLAQQDTRKRYPHPYYWAGFVLTGGPGIP